MNSCSGMPADRFAEEYLLGILSEADSAAFEDHYFACPACLGRLEALRAAQEQLRSHPVQIRRVPTPWPQRIAAASAIAATLIAAAVVYQWHHRASQPGQAVLAPPSAPAGSTVPGGVPAKGQPSVVAHTIASLADLSLPAYRTFNVRGAAVDPAYARGMKAYTAQNCPAARKSLAEIAAGDDMALPARFYTGVCLLHEGDLAAALTPLQQVARDNDSPQREAALYYLAQIALAQNDPSTARQKLQQTIALRGDFEKRARVQLAKLRAEAPRK